MLAERLQAILAERRAKQALRTLRILPGCADFCSNDYLGLARSAELKARVHQAWAEQPDLSLGATGSRLLSGQSSLVEALEAELAQFHQAEATLIFNSGYDANLGLLASLPQRGDTLFYDALVHASMRDGLRLSRAQSYAFRHNDLEHLREKLALAQGQVFIAVESVYSMDGDFAPLKELVALAQEIGAALIVDEAHATGVFGRFGEGLVGALGLETQVFARVHTFGKALGIHGALVAGSRDLREYLINYARSFIYTTALPPHSLLAVREAYRFVQEFPEKRVRLHQIIQDFRQGLAGFPVTQVLPSASPIQIVIIPGNESARLAAQSLQAEGLDVRAILSPTVPAGTERLRICLHTHNNQEELTRLNLLLSSLLTSARLC